MTAPILLTTSEAACLRGTTPRQIQRIVKAGHLSPYSTTKNGGYLFKASDVRRAPVSLKN